MIAILGIPPVLVGAVAASTGGSYWKIVQSSSSLSPIPLIYLKQPYRDSSSSSGLSHIKLQLLWPRRCTFACKQDDTETTDQISMDLDERML